MENIINKMLERINFKIRYAKENFTEWNTTHERRMAEIDGMIDKIVHDGKTFIKEHDGFIKVEDRGRKISDIMGELQSKYASLFDMMVERKNEMTM